MAKRSDAAQKKDKREIFMVIIAGFLLFVFGLIIAYLQVSAHTSYYSNPVDVIKEYWSIRQCLKYPPSGYPCAIPMCRCGLEEIFDFAGSVVFPAYAILSLLLYAVSTEFAGFVFSAKTRMKIRFWSKSFIIGAIIAIVFSVSTPWLVDWLINQQGEPLQPTANISFECQNIKIEIWNGDHYVVTGQGVFRNSGNQSDGACGLVRVINKDNSVAGEEVVCSSAPVPPNKTETVYIDVGLGVSYIYNLSDYKSVVCERAIPTNIG